MNYCEQCKIYVEKKCTAGYRNPTTDAKQAIVQANHKGEWPCTFAPHRNEFIAGYRPGIGVKIVKEGN